MAVYLRHPGTRPVVLGPMEPEAAGDRDGDERQGAKKRLRDGLPHPMQRTAGDTGDHAQHGVPDHAADAGRQRPLGRARQT